MAGIASCIAVALGSLMMMRMFPPFFTQFRAYPIPILLTLVGLSFVVGWFVSLGRSSIMMTPEHKNSRKRIIHSELSHMWPLLLFAVIFTMYTLYATSVKYEMVKDPLKIFAWTLDYLMVVWTIVAGYIIGRANRRMSTQSITYLVATLMAISFTFALGDYLSTAGYPNFIGSFLHTWNAYMREGGTSVFIVTQGGSLRASGLATFPFGLAAPSIMAAAWACSAKGNKAARTFIHACIFGILFVSGEGAVLFGYLVIIVAALGVSFMHLLVDKFGLTKIGGVLVIVSVAVLFFGMLGVVYALVPSTQVSSNPATPYARIIDNIAVYKYEISRGELDAATLDLISGGRLSHWSKSMKFIKEHPLGAGISYGLHANDTQSYSDILASFVWGGPLMLTALLLLYWWVAFKTRTPSAPNFGFYLAVGVVATGLVESLILESPFLFFGLFLLAAARKDIDRSMVPHFSWDSMK